MKWIVALAALLTAAPSIPQATGLGTQYYDGMPPPSYRGDGAAIVVFVSDIDAYCGPAPAGFIKLACAGTRDGAPIIFLPNPCFAGSRGDPYAVLTCHELQHTLGWGGDHPAE